MEQREREKGRGLRERMRMEEGIGQKGEVARDERGARVRGCTFDVKLADQERGEWHAESKGEREGERE